MRLAALCVVVLAPRLAAADPQVACAQAEAGSIEIDGMLDDWDGVARARAGGADSDASFDLRCLFDGQQLYLVVDVRDLNVIRQPRWNPAKPDGDDRLTVALSTAAGASALTLTAVPGVGPRAPVRLAGGKPALPRGLAIEDTLQPKGWSVELAIPAARIPGFSAGAPGIRALITLSDADVPKLAVTERAVAWDGTLALAKAGDVLAGLLSATRLTRAQLTFDVQADVDRARPGAERVVGGGGVLALVTDTFTFVRLPVQQAADVVKLEVIDLRGDGSKLVAARLRQRGNGGSRDLLSLWTVHAGKLEPLGAIELAKEQGGKRLRSAWKVEPARGWKQAKGARRVLVVRAEPAVGWDEDSYAEAPAGDAEPIHVPWDDDRVGGVFWIGADDRLATAALERR